MRYATIMKHGNKIKQQNASNTVRILPELISVPLKPMHSVEPPKQSGILNVTSARFNEPPVHPLIETQSRNISYCSFFAANDTPLLSNDDKQTQNITDFILNFEQLDDIL